MLASFRSFLPSSFFFHLGSSWLHLGPSWLHLDPPTPPPKAFAKKYEKRYKRAQAKTIDVVDFMTKTQLHSGGVILASGAALQKHEYSCAALLFVWNVTFDQKKRPPEQKSQQKANSSTNCRADLGWEYRIESCIFFLFVLLVQSFSYPTRRRKVHKTSPKIDHNIGEINSIFRKTERRRETNIWPKKGGPSAHYLPIESIDLSAGPFMANHSDVNGFPNRRAEP